MHLHYVQHVSHEGPARLERWADARGHEVTGTRIDRGESLPAPDDPDLLVVLGGPTGVGDPAAWLAEERAFLDDVLRTRTVVLGVCLGAQLLAATLGADVGPNPHRERGWFPVEATPAAADHPVFGALPETYVPFHWHGDRFAVPTDAERMAGSEACADQAFAYDDRAYGVQFHLETTPTSARELVAASDDLSEGPYAQDAEELLGADERFSALADHHDAFMDALAAHHGWA